MNNTVSYTATETHATIVINNGKVNAISHEVIDELNEALDQAIADKKVVILTGKEGILSAGYDLKTMTASAESAKALVTKGSELVYKMLSFPFPIIGALITKSSFGIYDKRIMKIYFSLLNNKEPN